MGDVWEGKRSSSRCLRASSCRSLPPGTRSEDRRKRRSSRAHLPHESARSFCSVSSSQTGMDSRINVFDMLGVAIGDVHIIRTAGGRVQDAIRSLVISQTQIGLDEVMLIQHTDCAALTFSEQSLRRSLLDKTIQGHLPSTAPFQISSTAFLPFPPAPRIHKHSTEDEARLQESVRWDVEWLRSNPLFDKRTQVSGWIYQVHDGVLREVDTSHLTEEEQLVLDEEIKRRTVEEEANEEKYHLSHPGGEAEQKG
ncbi:carbonic anhydrase [Mrakia frigida]|uniref:beta-class carbonic anhydrase n=1 Tax=Mrakia frigida TaxID=29902 RepID=UPI003FCBFCC0